MSLSTRSRPTLLAGLGLLSILGVAAATSRGAPVPRAARAPGDAALNHWVLTPPELNGNVREYVLELVDYVKRKHPQVSLEVYKTGNVARNPQVHLLLETVNTRAQQIFLGAMDDDEEGRRLWEAEEELFTLDRDVYLRLISSDPEKEKRLGPQGGFVQWSLRPRFVRFAEAVECAERLTRHLNTTYEQIYVRSFDEWAPRSGGIHFYFHGTGVAEWVSFEGAMRRDPDVRSILGDYPDVFVDDSFQDLAVEVIAR